jgi:hypothetical protein
MKTLSYISGTSNLLVNGQVIEFKNTKDRNKEVRKLEKQGYSFKGFDFSNTDEFQGLCQANQNGFRTFECTVLG